jgi:hypothetical protein
VQAQIQISWLSFLAMVYLLGLLQALAHRPTSLVTFVCERVCVGVCICVKEGPVCSGDV